MQKPQNLGEYDGREDHDKHIQLVNDRLNYYIIDEAFKCKLLTLALVGPTRMWLNSLPDGCIKSWIDLCSWISAHFTSQKRHPVTIVVLSSIMQGPEDNIQSYIDRFIQVVVEVKGVKETLKCLIFENDLLHDNPFHTKIRIKYVRLMRYWTWLSRI